MDNMKNDGEFGVLVTLLVMMLVIFGLVFLSSGCATLDQVREIRQAVASVEADVSALRIGDVSMQGDSVTQWILAAGSALVYPLIWRPARRWTQRRKR